LPRAWHGIFSAIEQRSEKMKETKVILSANKAGISLGALFALMHTLWSLLFASGLGANIHEYIRGMHYIGTQTMYAPFNLASAIIGVVLAAITGYIIGCGFAWIWNQTPE
jgi:hypothetical protein